MIETLPELRTAADLDPPADVRAAFAAFSRRLEARSALVWSEHCQECAYPSCYADCAFYTPRSDFHCRRFEAGIEPLRGGEGLFKVAFRKWGKLEAKGPSSLRPKADAARLEARDVRISQALSLPVSPLVVRRSLSARWNALKGAGRWRTPEGSAPTFVVEGWSPDGVERAYTLTILNEASKGIGSADTQASPCSTQSTLFQTSFILGPDYARLEVPLAAIEALVTLSDPHLVQIEPLGEAQGVVAVFGVCDFVVIARERSAATATAKVLVWDLDETLWDGVLAEDGLRGVRLKPGAENAVRTLDARGVLQTIASKNNHDEAMAALAHFGLAEFFLYPQIHYEPKSGSVAAQAAQLGLGLDSFVFIDDQPFERSEVSSAHPAVRTLGEEALTDLVSHPWFDLPVTPEGRRRRRLYQEEAARVVATAQAGNDYPAFLRNSALRLEIAPLNLMDVERVFELSQRTNQLNFNGRRFSREEVRAIADDRAASGVILRCADRFGDYGLVGFAIVDFRTGRLDDFFMSCRVQRKHVENAFFEWFRTSAMKGGASELVAAYAPTERNRAAHDMLLTLGFHEMDSQWRRNLEPFATADVVAVCASTQQEAA